MVDESALNAIRQSLAAEETRAMTRESALSAIHEALAAYQPPTPWADEVTQVLDSVIAEQFRLQSQVEDLERLLRDAIAGGVVMMEE